MPPKAGRKRAKPGPEDDGSAQLDLELAAIDIIVDNMKAEIENIIMQPMDDIKKLIDRHVLTMPSKIANMKMADFLKEGGGTLSAILEKQKKEQRAARTAMKPAMGVSRLGSGTVVKPTLGSRAPSSLNAAMDGVEESTKAASAPSAPAPLAPPVVGSHGAGMLPMTTPTAHAARSRIGPAMPSMPGGAGASAMPAMKTPAMALMKSSSLLPAALGAQTPGTSSISGFLPKTPGPDANRLPRARRRNEVVYHVPMSTNMSPLEGGGSESSAGMGMGMPTALIPIGAGAGGAATVMALAVGSQAVRLDDDAALDELAGSAESAAATLETLQALMDQAKAAQDRIRAARANVSAANSAAAAASAAASGAVVATGASRK